MLTWQAIYPDKTVDQASVANGDYTTLDRKNLVGFNLIDDKGVKQLTFPISEDKRFIFRKRVHLNPKLFPDVDAQTYLAGWQTKDKRVFLVLYSSGKVFKHEDVNGESEWPFTELTTHEKKAEP